MAVMRMNLFIWPFCLLFLASCAPAQKILIDEPQNRVLKVTDNLAPPEKELTVETGQWKVVFSLFYNGGPYRLYDKVYDPNMFDNLWKDPGYSQGSIFDYDVYLLGDQECMTTVGKNNNVGGASLEILENTPVRLRLRQRCYPRLNNGDGPPDDPYPELKMVLTTTDWTFYPTGRVNIKFDAVVAPEWNEIFSQGTGGTEKGVDANGTTVTAVNGTSFLYPWVTHGDSIESSFGGWGPIQISARVNETTLRLASPVPAGHNLDFRIRRNNILDETISIHADGDPGPAPRRSRWQGGSNGDRVYNNDRNGDFFRNENPPVQNDYVFAHWTRSPRGYGSLLAFNERFTGATYAVFNDLTYENLSYTQVARRGWRPFREHHRHFMAQMGIENSNILPRIKSVADAIPIADDYRNPYARSRKGTLQTGLDIKAYGFYVPTGEYRITADNNVAEIAFDAMRGGTVTAPHAYYSPAVLVSRINVPDNRISVELSIDNGKTFKKLTRDSYNLTTNAESSQLGSPHCRLFQLLRTIPTTATGQNAWVIRFGKK